MERLFIQIFTIMTDFVVQGHIYQGAFKLVVQFSWLVWSGPKKENDSFGPGPLRIHTDTEPKDTKPKGIVIVDWDTTF